MDREQSERKGERERQIEIFMGTSYSQRKLFAIQSTINQFTFRVFPYFGIPTHWIIYYELQLWLEVLQNYIGWNLIDFQERKNINQDGKYENTYCLVINYFMGEFYFFFWIYFELHSVFV